MKIGWIDFSERDRRRTLELIRHSQEESAVDELGIGVIRDAFANFFFPGTSTIQTRAKYFFLIPYSIMEVVEEYKASNNKNKSFEESLEWLLRRLDNLERETAVQLCADADKRGEDWVGIIGRLVLPNWVVRPPSAIYWNGIYKLGIFKGSGTNGPLSISEYFRIEIHNTLKMQNMPSGKSCTKGNSVEENEYDDYGAGDFEKHSFWALGLDRNWKTHLSINLTKKEALLLEEFISTSNEKSLFAFLLKEEELVNSISSDGDVIETFSSCVKAISKRLTGDYQPIKEMLTLADNFNRFMRVAFVLYNKKLSNEEALSLFEEVKGDISTIANGVDISLIFRKLSLVSYKYGGLFRFLSDLKQALVNNDFSKADDLITKREESIKGKKAKLKNLDKDYKGWVGLRGFDYRLFNARNIIRDIQIAKKDA